MPWCEPCGRFFNPNSLHEDGTCPSCDTVIAEPEPAPSIPWHFWVLLAAAGGYLGWRFIQMIGWFV